VFVFILASTSLYAVDRLVISSSSLDPVEVDGDCPADEVQAFLDGFEDRQEQMLGALEEFDSRSASGSQVGPGGASPEYSVVDIEDMRAGIRAVAQTPVPPCCVGALKAEVEFAEFVVEVVGGVQHCRWPKVACAIGAAWRLARGSKPYVDRMVDARDRAAELAGLELPSEGLSESNQEVPQSPRSGVPATSWSAASAHVAAERVASHDGCDRIRTSNSMDATFRITPRLITAPSDMASNTA
jgi:hypothetical protein